MKYGIGVGLLLALGGLVLFQAGCRKPEVRLTEFRGAWIATVVNIDWPSSPGLPVEEQKAELTKLLDLARDMNLNAVFFQIRPACDAFYASELEPWSEYLTGQMGKAPEPFYDPLAFAVEEAHKRGLELHAWFNPYRARHPSKRGEASADHVSLRRPELVRTYGGYLWLDPGEPDVQDYTVGVILDVVRRYDIDGVHLDDYFYPYPVKDADGNDVPFPDDASYARYRESGGTLERDDWRRENVNIVVRRLNEEVHAIKPDVAFGISPFGIWRPDNPSGIQGMDQYARIYADCRKWLREGWVDYLAPQLYWPTFQDAQSYPRLLEWWVGENVADKLVLAGNAAYRVVGEPHQWGAEEYVKQIRLTRELGAGGNIHFHLRIFLDNPELAEALRTEVYAGPAAVPRMR